MNPYEFEAGSAQLVEQVDGTWVAQFSASAYDPQTFNETSNSVVGSTRTIKFSVLGNETGSVSYHAGASAPYTRGSETSVQLELFHGGTKKGHVSVAYP